MLGKGKVSQSLIDAVQKIQEYDTKDGKFVHKARPGSYGGSAQEPRSAFDVLSGPKKKDIEDMEKKPLKKEEFELDEGLMSHIILGKKVKNDESGHDQTVHHKGEHIGNIHSYAHIDYETGKKTGRTKWATSDKHGDTMTVGHITPEEGIDELRWVHAHQKKESKLKKEEFESIDELSKKTLGSYAKKATDDVSYHSFDAGQRSDRDPERLKTDKKAMSRQAGVNKAIDRLAKEDTDDCVSPTQAKKIADKEVGKHEKKLHKESAFKSKLIESIKHKEKEEELVDESEMSDSQMKKREKIVMSMKGKEADFRKKYGKNWKNVMYATATKQAMKEETEELDEGLMSHIILGKKVKNDESGHDQTVHHKGEHIGNIHSYAHIDYETGKKTGRTKWATSDKHGDTMTVGHITPEEGIDELRWVHAHQKKESKLKKEEFEGLDETQETNLEEGIASIIKKGLKTAGRVLGGPDDEGQLKDLQRKMGVPQTGKVPHAKQNEEVEQIDETNLSNMSLTHLWNAHEKAFARGRHAFTKKATDVHKDIANHVKKHYGDDVAKDMIDHSIYSDIHRTGGGYGNTDYKHKAQELRKKHNIGVEYNRGPGRTNEEVELTEAEVTTSADTPGIYVTDMLQGRVKGGKVNSFKSFKAQLRTDGEMKAPKEIDRGEDTREKQKITTNPGPVDVKMDDKLAGPTPFTHHATEKKVTSEEVRGELKHIRSKEEKHYSKEIGSFKKKLLGKQVNQEGKDPMMDAGVGSTPDFATNGSWKKETPWHKSKGPDVVTDKSGAKHTPMSKVRDLARNALKKTKNEVLGIAPDNN